MGQTIGENAGISGVDINLPSAFSELYTAGMVAILDTGVDISHPDLAENVFVNTAEIPGNGVDDDGNGYIDDISGWNFAGYIDEEHNGSNLVYDHTASEKHGTHIAGIIAAQKNNIGVEGVAPNAKILPVKFIENETGTVFNAIKAIEYAEMMGAAVANISWGLTGYSHALYEAVSASTMLFVCAAGNNAADTSTSPVYPACLQLSNVLSVGAVNNRGELAGFSNYGDAVTVYAPGVDIYSTTPENSYGYMSGTSMAAPFVSGIAAVIAGVDGGLEPSDMISAISENLTVPSNGGAGNNCGIPNAEGVMNRLALFTEIENVQEISYAFHYVNNTVVLTMPAAEGAAPATCYIEDPNHKVVFIGSVPVVNGQYTLSVKLDEPIDGTYTGKLKMQEGQAVDIAFEWDSFIYCAKEIDCVMNEEFNLITAIENAAAKDGRQYVVNYDPAKLALIDLCALTYDKELTAGLIDGTSISILDVDTACGKIVFVHLDNTAGSVSGILNAVKFRGLVSNAKTTITLGWKDE